MSRLFAGPFSAPSFSVQPLCLRFLRRRLPPHCSTFSPQRFRFLPSRWPPPLEVSLLLQSFFFCRFVFDRLAFDCRFPFHSRLPLRQQRIIRNVDCPSGSPPYFSQTKGNVSSDLRVIALFSSPQYQTYFVHIQRLRSSSGPWPLKSGVPTRRSAIMFNSPETLGSGCFCSV